MGSLGVDFEYGLDGSTNLTNYGLMIPLFLVTLFAIVVFASIALLAIYSVRGNDAAYAIDPRLQRTGLDIRLQKQTGTKQDVCASLPELPMCQGKERDPETQTIKLSRSNAWF